MTRPRIGIVGEGFVGKSMCRRFPPGEVAKYMENSFYAVKVAFCNEFFDIARAHGVDYNALREIWLADPRISRDHTFVYPENRGFSGKYLPKDVIAILHSSAEHNFEPPLLKSVMDINEAHRADDPTYAPYRPFDLLRAVSMVEPRKGKRHGRS